MNGPPSLRGAVSVDFGGQTVELVLTLEAMARIEEAFEVDSFELAAPMLGKVIAGDGTQRATVDKRALSKFWRAVLDGNGRGDLEFEAMPINPYALWVAAVQLVNATQETWFAADAKPEKAKSRPLAGKRAGASG